MIKFEIYGKELKTMIDKALAAVDKKASFPSLRRIYFEVQNGNLYVSSMDSEQYLRVLSDSVWRSSDGIIGIDIDDLKVITKMTDNLTFTEITENPEIRKVMVKCGKKSITMSGYDFDVEDFIHEMENPVETILHETESWMYETLVNLATFTGCHSGWNEVFESINFNTVDGRAEALDGHRLAMRKMSEENTRHQNGNRSVMLHTMSVPVMKKVLDKKSDAEIAMYQDEKYICIMGNDFTYKIRRVEAAEYFKVSQMLPNRYDATYSFTADRENMIDVMAYDAELCKAGKNTEPSPIIMSAVDYDLYVYTRTAKFEVADVMETCGLEWDDGLFVGFNPSYILDAVKVVDSENPVFRGFGAKSPMMIEGDTYSFMVLPVNFNTFKFSSEAMVNYIRKQEAV